jgi:hypothetical protein
MENSQPSAPAYFSLGARTMTANELAEALRHVVHDAADAGLDRETLLSEIDDIADAMRTCDE